MGLLAFAFTVLSSAASQADVVSPCDLENVAFEEVAIEGVAIEGVASPFLQARYSVAKGQSDRQSSEFWLVAGSCPLDPQYAFALFASEAEAEAAASAVLVALSEGGNRRYADAMEEMRRHGGRAGVVFDSFYCGCEDRD